MSTSSLPTPCHNNNIANKKLSLPSSLHSSIHPSSTTKTTTCTTTTINKHTPNTLYTKIHNQWYNMKDFDHPGGKSAISLIAGRDGTILFESYHPFVNQSKLKAILNKYRVPSTLQLQLKTLEQESASMPSIDGIFDWPVNGSEFANDIKQVVHTYFTNRAQKLNIPLKQAMKGTNYRYLQQLCMGVAFVFSVYYMVTSVSVTSMIVCPLTAWIFAVNTFHDASHFALSPSPTINTLVSYLFPYFTSPSTWALQHVIGHHAYPNLPHLDPDVNHTAHLRRDHPKMPWINAHGQQHWASRLVPHWIMATTFGLNMINEVDAFFKHTYNDAVPIYPQVHLHLVLHLLTRFMSMIVILFWPFYFHYQTLSLTWLILFGLVPSFIFSSLFMLNTQINHLTPTQLTQQDRDWYKHQVLTAQNFGLQSVFHFYMSGGLNYQIEHHLFPGVNHCHLPHLQPLISAVCLKHRVSYAAAPGYLDALRTYWAHTNNMAVKPKDS